MSKVTLEQIATQVEKTFQVTLDGLRVKNRSFVFIDARLALAVIAREYNYTYQSIADYISRDHSAVMSYYMVYLNLSNRVSRDRLLLQKIDQVRKEVALCC